MKKYIKLLSLILTMSLFSSCDENKNDIVFDDVNGQTLIQFETTSASIPTPAEGTTTLDVEVYVTTKSNVARTISLEIDSSVADAASSDQYTLSNVVIEAGSHVGTLTVTTNYDAIPEEGSSYIVIKLTSIENSADALILDGTISLELFRKCPPVTGDYTFILYDVYCDGWQGSKIIVDVDGVKTELTIASGARILENCGGPLTVGEQTVNIPEGTDTVTFTWSSGAYPEECAFDIFDSNGTLIVSEGNPDDYDTPPSDGLIAFNPCNF